MKKILFVDDEQKVLDGLRRTFRVMRHEWDMRFVENGQDALRALDTEKFDVVVSDMRMPGMDGAQLLGHIRERHPDVVRIILSGYSDQEMIMKSVKVAHQYLSKPCDTDVLKATVSRAFALRDIMSNETLAGIISRIDKLPSAPTVYQEVVQAMESPNTSISQIADIISRDIGMTAKILHLANSAFFGISHNVTSIERALSLLGLETLVSLVLTIQIFAQHEHTAIEGFSIQSLMNHCMSTGALAKLVAREEQQERSVVDDCFMGGLLHDVGKLVLATSLSESYEQIVQEARETQQPTVAVEQKILGTTHAEVGAYLLGLWGLPDPIVEAVAFHHEPRRCPVRSFGPLAAVHVGNALAKQVRSNHPGHAPDIGYLDELKLAHRLPVWERAAKILDPRGKNDG